MHFTRAYRGRYTMYMAKVWLAVDAIGAAAVQGLERLVGWRRRRLLKKIARAERRNQLAEWVRAFLWAAMVVLIINQYLLQAYRIPSASMRDTLIESDRLFVNKLVYGPELVPAAGKISWRRVPQSGEVIIFENPSYAKRGVLFSVVQRVVYMVSLSLIDLDRDSAGNQRASLLIKRGFGQPHDVVRLEHGEPLFRSVANSNFIDEAVYMGATGLSYRAGRLVQSSAYQVHRDGAIAFAHQEYGLALNDSEQLAINQLSGMAAIDGYFFEQVRNRRLLELNPHQVHRLHRLQRAQMGWYVPTGYVLPLGDNRDNSRDGRYYGVIPHSSILGKAQVIYWPPRRMRIIR